MDGLIMKTKKGIYYIIDEEFQKIASSYGWEVNNKGYLQAYYHGKTALLHRIILDASKGVQVDHINGNPLDNRRSNLRICTHRQNNQYRHKVRASSGFKGVRKMVRGSNWQCGITINGKYMHLGVFATKEEAARAYDKKALEVFGEYANLNFKEK